MQKALIRANLCKMKEPIHCSAADLPAEQTDVGLPREVQLVSVRKSILPGSAVTVISH